MSKKLRNAVGMGVCIAAGVLGFIPGLLPFRTSEEIAGKLACVALIALFFLKNIWLKLFLLWSVVRVLITCNPPSIITLHNIAFYLVMLQIIADYVNKDNVKHVLNAICLIILAQVAITFLQWCGIWFVIIPRGFDFKTCHEFFGNTQFPLYIAFNPEDYRCHITGFTSNINLSAALVAMGIPAFLRRKWCWFIPVVLLCLFIHRSLGGFIPAFAVLFIYALYKTRGMVRVYLSLGVLFGAIFTLWIASVLLPEAPLLAKNGSIGCRLMIWDLTIKKLIPFHWIIGWGIGQGQYLWKIILQETKDASVIWLHSHNEYIHLWLEMGIFGFSLVMGYLTTQVMGFFKRIDSIKFIVGLGILAGLINCGVNFTMHVTVGIVLVVYLAIMQKLNMEE